MVFLSTTGKIEFSHSSDGSFSILWLWPHLQSITTDEDAQAQYIGLLKVSAAFQNEWLTAFDQMPASKSQNLYMTDFIQSLIDNGHDVTASLHSGGWFGPTAEPHRSKDPPQSPPSALRRCISMESGRMSCCSRNKMAFILFFNMPLYTIFTTNEDRYFAQKIEFSINFFFVWLK